MATIYVDLQGVKQLRAKLGRFSSAIGAELEYYLEDVSNYAKVKAQAYAPKDLGRGAKSIQAQIIDRSLIMSVGGAEKSLAATVQTGVFYMHVMEYGRRPGATPPSTKHVAAWGRRHGFSTKRAIYVLAQSIGRKGIRGRHFMAFAAQDTDIYARRRLNILSNRVVVWMK